jgi:quercetin dioxygenase-like cupin family protein
MGAPDDMDLATGYVLGNLDAQTRERARLRAVEDKAFAAEVQAWETRLAPLAISGEQALPAGLFAKIEGAIAASQVELPGTITKRAGTGQWVQAAPGLKIKILNEIAAASRQTFMAWLEPGAEYTDHDHDQDEEIYMVEGDLIIGDVVLKTGDFHVARAGKHHPTHRTKTGCICIISQALGPV